MSPRVMSPLDYSYRFCFVDFIIRAKVQRITVFNVIFTLKKKRKAASVEKTAANWSWFGEQRSGRSQRSGAPLIFRASSILDQKIFATFVSFVSLQQKKNVFTLQENTKLSTLRLLRTVLCRLTVQKTPLHVSGLQASWCSQTRVLINPQKSKACFSIFSLRTGAAFAYIHFVSAVKFTLHH